jgi:hypothetical protein
MIVLTSTREVIVSALGFLCSRFQARWTLIRPWPCANAPWRSRKRAVDRSASRREAGLHCSPVAFAALTRSAAAPAVAGDAIDVPLNMP